jgi:murein DD-endopeptidase MepM/ murein hydrolase activator NlpD
MLNPAATPTLLKCYPDEVFGGERKVSSTRTFPRGKLAYVLFLSAVASAATTSKAANSSIVRWEPARLVNGSPVLFRVKPAARIESLSGKWLDHEVFFSFDPATRLWYGLAGVSLETRAGKYLLSLTGKTPEGKEILFNHQVTVAKGKYRRIEVNVPKQFTEPSPEQLHEIKEEQALKKDVFSRMDPNREWMGRFVPPVSASISDVFGTARVFNGETQSMHQGLDYAVPSGTPVDALNRGTVLLARPLFFEGNCVVLDHGQGLLSLYMHLSKLEVKEGDPVTKGQEIALSGGTGRATGPHLHIAVRWQGIYVNPAILLSLKLP